MVPAGLRTFRSSFRTAMLAGLFITAVLLLCTQFAEAAPSCSGASSNNGVSDATCANGVVLDWCNQEACGKGPGETCGGRWNEHGDCGQGMFCGCGICNGCNRRLKCYFNAKC